MSVPSISKRIASGFSTLPPPVIPERTVVDELAALRIGDTFNQYADSELRRERLAGYLERRKSARYLLVGEAAGYRGARVSGLPFTSEPQGSGYAPAAATR